jgi:hypothetical protein
MLKDETSMTVNTVAMVPDFTLPNRQLMKASKDYYNLAVTEKTFAFLPAVQDKTQYVRDQLNGTDQQAGEDIKRVITALNNINFTSVLARIEEIGGMAAVASDVREERLAELLNYCSGRVTGALVQVDNAARHLHEASQELRSITFADVGVDSLRVETGQLARLRQTWAQLTDDRAKLVVEKDAINQQLAQFNAPTWLDIFKKQIPSAAEMEAIIKLVTTKKPDREFLELALKRLEGNLEGIEEGRRYANLAEARDGVRKRLDDVQAEIKQFDQDIRAQGSKVEKLQAIGGLDQFTADWLGEAGKVLAAYEQFSQASKSQILRDVRSIRAMAGQLEAMLGYLRAIIWL